MCSQQNKMCRGTHKEMCGNAQMLKGLLVGCILKIVSKKETYGYELCEKLKEYNFEEISEKTVYPILTRLENKGFLLSAKKDSPYGPKRKYYHITEEGKEALEGFVRSWNKMKSNIDMIINEK